MAEQELKAGATGGSVPALHDALASAGLRIAAGEVKRARFGPSTKAALITWQEQRGLEPSGEVDAKTAGSLQLPSIPQPPKGASTQRPDRGTGSSAGGPTDTLPPQSDNTIPPEFQFLVRGQVVYKGGLPLADISVRAFNKELRYEDPLGQTAIQGLDLSGSAHHILSQKSQERADHRVVRPLRAADRFRHDEHPSRSDHVGAHLAGELGMALKQRLVEP